MSHRRLILVTLLILCGWALPDSAAAPPEPDAPAASLLLIPIPDGAALTRLAATGLPAYAHFYGSDGAYVLTAADASDLTTLGAARLPVRVLGAQAIEGPFYLAYPARGHAPADWEPFGQPLYVDDRATLLQTTAERAETLAATGVEIARITFVPIVFSASSATAFPPVTTPDPVIQGMLDAVHMGTVQQYTGDLTGEWPAMIRGESYLIRSRHTTSGTPIQQATYYVGDHLAALGMEVEYHEWERNRPPNVIGQKTGETRPEDVYMLTAHLDNMPAGLTAPGADDNASGSVGVLLAADILSQYRWDCTLRFALWTGEEQGLMGSNVYAERARANNEKILGVLNLDMIAWNTPGSTSEIDLHAKGSMPATVELANQFASVVDAYNLNLVPEVRSDGTGASDHASFWDSGYTAILGIEDYYPGNNDFNPYYHTINDRIDKLDMAYYTEFIKASVAELAHMTGCLVKTPTEPAATARLSPEGITLIWQHTVPNTAYQVHRGVKPYFTPDAGTLQTTMSPPFPSPLTYLDADSGAGSTDLNHFYAVLGMNEAGDSAVSNRTGEFDLALVHP